MYRVPRSINPLKPREIFDEYEYFAQEKQLRLEHLAMHESKRKYDWIERARERRQEGKKEERKEEEGRE